MTITEEIGTKAGQYLRLYRPVPGTELGDALIAATAVLHGCALFARNRKHYPVGDIRFY